MRKFSTKMGVTAFFAFAVFAFSIFQASAEVVEVDCDDGDTIQAALDEAVDGDTINVSGTCNEAITIDKNGIQLIGGGFSLASRGATINAVGEKVAVDILALNVSIVGFLNIESDDRGIRVQSGSATIRNNGIKTVNVERNGAADIRNNTIEKSLDP